MLKISGVKGGDSSAVYLDALMGAISDIGRNRNNDNLNIIVAESPDIIEPEVQCRIKLQYGSFKTHCVRAHDFIPASNVDLSKIYISNVTGDNAISLIDSSRG